MSSSVLIPVRERFAPQDVLLRDPSGGRTGTIMIVDDETINIKIAEKYLRDAGFHDFITTNDSRLAIDLVRQHRPDVILLDIVMPHVSGLNILEVIRGDLDLAHLPVLVLTAVADDVTKGEALELGATDFLNKPVKPTELIPRVRNSLLLKANYDHMAAHSRRLESEVRQRTEELAQSREEVIHVMACAAEYRDMDTANHVLRVGRYASTVARELGFSEERAQLIEHAAILHDVGKIGIPDAILLKPGKLNQKEIEQMQKHCEYGLRILRGVSSQAPIGLDDSASGGLSQSPILRIAATIAMSHHEKWDGSGYPIGLAGEAIPIEGRITAVADVFDALGSRRPYKEPIAVDSCFEILRKGRGSHFDPDVLDAFFARADDIIDIFEALVD